MSNVTHLGSLSADSRASGNSEERRGAPVSVMTESRPTGPGSVPGAEAAITVSHLRKTYGPVVAVDDVSFSVAEG